VKNKPLILRRQVNLDVDEILAYYLSKHAEAAAFSFVESLEHAYTTISLYPGTGSPRYAHELNIPGLRFWPLSNFPHLAFYIEENDHIDVWRILHSKRDIPAHLQD
jgi:toxin ParE1/3/4